MNKLRYRLVFNKARGMLMAVQETARSHGKGPGETPAPAGVAQAWGPPGLRPLALLLAGAFGGALVSGAALAQIVADPNAPGHERPTVLNAANGVLQVNVQTPSAAGVSRNVYSQFDVPKSGAILNNSRTDVQTQLGGWVQANPWMKAGTARVILNEVNSSNPSRLQGFIEVAGQRAEAVIANPAGIVVDGGGFINVSRATLTTGRPLMSDGQLTGFDVQRGQIALEGAGLNASQTDYTALIARSVQINAGLWAPRLDVIAGVNQVGYGDTPAVTPKRQDGAVDPDAPRYAIDVAQLGGMYANHIWLVGTESGVGVRNAGEIGAAAGDLVVTSSGRLENRGSMEAAGRLQAQAQAIDNSGSLRATGGLELKAQEMRNAGQLATSAEARIAVTGLLDNSAGTIEANRVEIAAAALRNRDGSIVQTGTMALAVTARQLSNNAGTLGQAAAEAAAPAPALPGNGTEQPAPVSGGGAGTPGPGAEAPAQPPAATTPAPVPVPAGVLNADTLDNDGGLIAASGGIGATSASFANRGGEAHLERLEVGGSLFDNGGGKLNVRGALRADTNSFGNRDGQVRVGGTAAIVAGAVDNGGGLLQASNLAVQAGELDNSGGTLRHTGAAPVTLTVGGELRQQKGSIDSAASLALRAGSISGTEGVLNVTGDLDLESGATSAAQGSWRIGGDARIATGAFDASGGGISAGGDLALDAAGIVNADGKIVAGGAATVRAAGNLDNTGGLVQAAGALEVRADGALLNRAGTVETLGQRAALALEAAQLDNTAGKVVNAGTGATGIRAGSIASSGLIGGNGALDIVADAFANDSGGRVIAAAGMALSVSGLLANQGTIATASGGNGLLTVDAGRLDNDGGALQADADARIAAAAGLSNIGGTIAAAGLQLDAGAAIDNAKGAILAERLAVRGASIGNAQGRIVASGPDAALVQATGAIDNGGVIGARGALTLDARELDNRAGAEIATEGALDLAIGTRMANAGKVSSTGALTFASNGAALQNSGAILAGEAVRLDLDSIDNRGGSIATVEGAAIVLAANALDNRGGKLVSGAAAELGIAGDLDNTGGVVQAGGALRIDAGAALRNAAGVVEALGAQALLDLKAGALDNGNGRIVNVGSGATTIDAASIASSGLIAGNGELALAARTLQSSGELRSGAALTLDVSERLDNSGTVSAAASLRLEHSAATVRNSGTIVAGGAIALSAAEVDNSGGKIATARDSNADLVLEANRIVNNGGAIMADRSVTLAAGGDVANAGGLVQAKRDLAIDADGALDNLGGTLETLSSDSTLQLAAAALGNDKGRIVNTGSAGTTIDVAGTLDNGNGELAGNGKLALHAQALRSSADGVIAAGAALGLDVDGAIDNAGTISSRAALDLASGSLKNSGTVVAGAGAAIRTGQLDNDGGRIATAAGSGASVDITAESLSNRDGRIHAQDALGLTVTGAIDNTKGTLQGMTRLEVTADGALSNDGGLVEASGAAATLDLTVQSIDNGSGRIVNVGTGDTRVQVTGDIASHGVIAGNGKLTLAGQQMVNGAGGTLSSGAAMDLQASLRLDNAGAISSAGAFTLDQAAASVANSGTLSAGGSVLLRADAIANDGGQIATANGAAIALDSANALGNRGGTIATAGDATLRAGGTLDNTGGTIETGGAASTLALDAAAIANSGRIVNSGAGSTTIASRAGIVNDGTIGGNGTLVLNGTTLRNGAGGAVIAGTALELALSQALENAGGSITSGGALRFNQVGATFANSGSIGAGGAIDIRASSIGNTGGGQLYTAAGSGAAINLQTGDLNNTGGKAAADGRLDIAAGGAVHNDAGTLHGAQGLALSAGQLLANGSGIIEAAGGLLEVRAASIASSGRIVNGGSGETTVTSGADIVNAGTIAGNGGLAITSQVLHNYAGGQIGAGRDLVLGVARDLTNAGAISSAGTLTFAQAGAGFTNSGRIDAGGRISLGAAWFNNDGGRITTVTGSGADIDVTAPGLSNRGGAILADGRATFALNGALDNRGGTLQAGSGLAVNANGLLSNDAGTIEATGANAGLSIDTAAIDNGGGRIANLGRGETLLASQGAILNNGAIGAKGSLVLRGQELQNGAAGQIASEGNLTLDIKRQWTNRGSVNSGGTLTFDQAGATFVNSGRVLAGGNVLINAWHVDNSGGLLGTGEGSGADLRLSTQSLVNSGGRIAADRDLNITTHGMSGMGQLFGGRDLSLSMDGDYVHGESAQQFQANRDLNLAVTGNIVNKSAFQAAGKLTLSGQNITNQANATIEARDLALNAAGNLDNAGEIQGEHTLDIGATVVRNTGVIVGGNVTLSAWDMDNSGGAALVGATDALRLAVGGTLNNTTGATLYSSGSMHIGGSGGGETIVVNNHSSTIEAVGDLAITAGTITNVRDNVRVEKVQTLDETTVMLPPSWYNNKGRNYRYYDANSSNYAPRELYFVHPDDILEETPMVTPDGFTVVRAVIRTHDNDSAFFTARSAEYGAYGTQERILNTEGTRVIYYYEKTAMANPDQQGSRANILDGQQDVKSWEKEVELSSAYGRCSTDCYRLVTQPGYDDPRTTILRHTLKEFEKEHDKLEIRRDAHHVVVEDRVADGAGPLSQILSGGNMTLTTSGGIDNRYGDIKARGRLDMLGQGPIRNEGATLYRTHQFNGTSYTDAGDKPRYENASISEVIGSAKGTIHGEQGVFITGRSFANVDVTAGTVGNIRDSVRVIGSGQSGAGSAGANAAAGKGGGGVAGDVTGQWSDDPALAGAQSASAGTNLAANGHGNASGVQNGSIAGGAADGSGVRSNGQLTVVSQHGAGQVGADDVRSKLGAAGQGATSVQAGSIGEARKVAPGGLFIQNPNASGDYLFETRPQFAKQDQWTSSDYLLDQVAFDPAMNHKRLGDGFYEQRLVREQLSQLAGRTALTGASDDSIYKELLTNGVSAAREFGLRPGIALSAEQVAHLTSDIVWMVSETVQLPDGRIETVLVPKVYAATLGREALRPGGALVTGNGVTINVTDSITNAGGVIDGGNGRTLLVAGQDIVNRGGGIAGASVGLDAGRDIKNESLAVTESWATTQNGGSHTLLSNQASITATGALTVEAGRNLTDLAGKLTAGSAVITAGNEIRFDTVKTGSTYQSQIGDATQNDSSVTHQLSQVNIGGDLTMKAGGDLNLTGTQVAIGTGGKGSGLIAAGGAVNIAAVTNEANSSLKTDPSGKSYDKDVRENQTVVGAGVAATGDLTVKAGVGGSADLNITGSALAAGGKVILTASNDVNIVSATEDHLSDTASHRESSSTFKKSSSTRTDYSASTLAIGSSISGENVTVVAGNDITVGASEVTAKEALGLQAGRDLIVTTAESTNSERHTLEEKKSGFSLSAGGFGYSKGQSNQTNNGDTVTQVGSVLSGGSVTTTSGRDTLIQGSTVVADENIAIAAGRDLSIVSAENSATEASASSSKKSGMIGSFFQPSIGTVKTTQDGTRDQVTQVGSQVASLGGNVTLSAGNKYTQTSSDVLAQAGDIAIVGKDVLISGAYDTSNGTDHSTYSKTAIGGTVSVPLVDALKTVANMAEAATDTGNARMKALAALNSAAALKDAPTSVEAIQKAGVRVSVSLGNTKSESNTVTTSTTAVGSTIKAGGNVTIVASGDGQNSNLTAIGSDISGGKNVSLMADNQVNLVAAENTASQHSTNTSSGSSIGVGFGVGGTSNGFSIDLAVSKARGKADGEDVTHTNTHVNGGNNVTVISGGDTTLKGGVISGANVVADIGGDLNIESLQDSSTFDSKQKSAELNASLCIPPACYGASTVGGNFSKSEVNGDFLSVQEQSGIKAGDGGFQVAVGGNTDLKGGVLASSQAAVDQGKNLLMTGSLTASDLQNKDEHSASGFALSGSVSGTFGDQSGVEKLTDAQQEAAKAPGKPSASGGFGSASGSQSSITMSGISGGAVVITDQDKQLGTGQSKEAILASIDRAVTSESSQASAGSLVKGWDAQQLQKDMDAQVAITQKFSTVAPKEIADFAEKKIKELQAQGASQEEIEKWEDGGVYRVALHTVSGGLSGGLSGALGGGVIAESAKLLNSLQSNAAAALVEQGMSPEAAKAMAQSLAQVTALGIGAIVGGEVGAATGLAIDTNNRQLHEDEKTILKRQQLGKTPDQQRRLAEAACALTHCSAGLPDGPEKERLQEQEKRGQSYLVEQTSLLETGKFIYTESEKSKDEIRWVANKATNGWSDKISNVIDLAIKTADGELKSFGSEAYNLIRLSLTNGSGSNFQVPPDFPDDSNWPRPTGGIIGGMPILACLPPVCTVGIVPVVSPGKSTHTPNHVLLSNNNDDTSRVDAAAENKGTSGSQGVDTTSPRVNNEPAFLKRIKDGNDFNKTREVAYPYNEVYIDSPTGSGYTRLDSYNPSTGEIVSRKFTQLSEIQEQTALKYINELTNKYPVNAKIANVPSSKELAGKPLVGQQYLEIPVQNHPIPQSVLTAAERAGIIIRDVSGRVY